MNLSEHIKKKRRMRGYLPQWLSLIQSCFLSDNMKEAYKKLHIERLKLL